MGKYIDGSGLSHFMGIIKGWAFPKADVPKQAITYARDANAPDTLALGIVADGTATNFPLASASNSGLMSKADKTKLNGVATGAEVNQNAFGNVKVGTTTVAADAKTDTLELVAGSNVTLTPDATNDKVTIAATDTRYDTAEADGTQGLLVWEGPSYDGTYLVHALVQSGFVTFENYELEADDIPDLPANKINTGTFDAARIPSLAASKITSGTFDAARIPSLAISKITNLQTTLDAKAPLASPALTGTPTAPTAAAGTNTTQIATTAFVTNAVGTATAGALQYKGTATKESDISGQAYKKGWYYVVATAGTYFGKVCEVGDMLIAKQDKTSTPANDWDAIQSNIEVLSNAEIDTLWAAA